MTAAAPALDSYDSVDPRHDVPLANYALNSHTFETDVKVHDRVDGITVVSHVLICLADTSYHEVALYDTRSLDTRDWKWKVMESNLDRVYSRLVYRAVWEAIEVGHRVYGVRWIDGRPEAVITRECAIHCGLISE